MPNPTKIKTNKNPKSVSKARIRAPKFKEIWDSYPHSEIKHPDPRNGKDLYENHCAINLSEALLNAEIGLQSFKGSKCSNCLRKDHSRHALVAQQLADWLRLRPFPGCPAPLISTGTNFESAFANKQGIILFQDYWQRPGEVGPNRTGDHIDLWDHKSMADLGTLISFIRINLGVSEPHLNVSDFRLSKAVLLWEIK